MPHGSLVRRKFRSFLDIRDAPDVFDCSGSDESLQGGNLIGTTDSYNTQEFKSSSGGTDALKRAFSRTFSWRRRKNAASSAGHDADVIAINKSMKFKETCKIFVIGYSGVGKTAAVVRFLTGRYIHEYQSTEEECYTRSIKLDGDFVDVQITSMTSKIKNYDEVLADSCVGIILAYSVVDFMSFCYVQRLLDEMNCINQNPVVLIGTKVDLNERRCIHRVVAQKLAAVNGCKYFEVSAAANIDVQDCFKGLVRQLIRSRKDTSHSANGRMGRRRSSIS